MRIYKNGSPNSNPNYLKNALKKMNGKISRPGFVISCSGLTAWFGMTESTFATTAALYILEWF